MRVIFSIIVLLFVVGLFGQQWLPLDKGLHCPDLAAGTGTVRELFVHESNDELYAIGVLRFNYPINLIISVQVK